MASVPESDGARPESAEAKTEKKRKEIFDLETELAKKRRRLAKLEAETQSEEESCSLIVTVDEDATYEEYYIPNRLITDQERGALEKMVEKQTCDAMCSGDDEYMKWVILLNTWPVKSAERDLEDFRKDFEELKDYDTPGKWNPYSAQNLPQNPRCKWRVDHVYAFNLFS
jgi:hypothetical protein